MAKRKRRAALRLTLVLAGLLTLTSTGYVVRNVTYAARDAHRVTRAGFVERQVHIDGSTVNYAEGPDNGPPLVLIHGQVSAWQSWNRVLPELSRHFHVLAVDCYGHGGSAWEPEKYSAVTLAADMERFLAEVVGEPAVVAGHSSGGLVAALLAAEAPERVAGVVLEDPPLFSSVLPRAENTFNHVDLASTAHAFLDDDDPDFTGYYLRNAAMWDLFQDAKEPVQNSALSYRERHPDRPVRVFYLPPSINQLFHSMDSYDPRFGDAFYTGDFHEGFDHANTLERITVPTALIHANWSYDDNGLLLAAMDGDDAERARSLISDVEFHRVDSGHGFHFEKPRAFERIVLGLADRL